MTNQWHGGKGDKPRKDADRDAYRKGWDRIFSTDKGKSGNGSTKK